MKLSLILRKLLFYPFRFEKLHTYLPLVYRLRYSSDATSSSIVEESTLSVRTELTHLLLSYNPSVIVDYGCGFGATALSLLNAGYTGVYIGVDTQTPSLLQLKDQLNVGKYSNPSILFCNSKHTPSVHNAVVLMDAVCIYNHPEKLAHHISELIASGNLIILHEPFIPSNDLPNNLYHFNSTSATWSYSQQFFTEICLSMNAPFVLRTLSPSSQKWTSNDCILILNSSV